MWKPVEVLEAKMTLKKCSKPKLSNTGGVAIQINGHFGGLLLAVGIIKKQVLCWKKRPLLADTHSHFILQFSVRFEFPGENAVSFILHHGDWLDFVDKFYSAIEMNLTSTTPPACENGKHKNWNSRMFWESKFRIRPNSACSLDWV